MLSVICQTVSGVILQLSDPGLCFEKYQTGLEVRGVAGYGHQQSLRSRSEFLHHAR
jgi:hypothetical protein